MRTKELATIQKPPLLAWVQLQKTLEKVKSQDYQSNYITIWSIAQMNRT